MAGAGSTIPEYGVVEETPTSERSPLLGNPGSSSSRAYNSTDGETTAATTTTPTGDEPTTDDDDGPAAGGARIPVSRRKLATILCALWIGTFLAALDQTLLTTLLSPISSEFSSSASLSWLATAYLIATAALQPLFGKLTDIFGRRAGLVWCNALFLIGTLWCGLAGGVGSMVVGRVIAGLGGGGLTTIAVVTTSDVVSLRDRGVVQGVSNVVFGVGSGLGGVFGGVVSDWVGWRWAFLGQVPVILVSMVVVGLVLDLPTAPTVGSSPTPPRTTTTGSSKVNGSNTPTSSTQPSLNPENTNTTTPVKITSLSRVDFLGSLTLVTALTLLLLALNSGGNLVPWTHPLIPSSIALSVVFLLVFIFIEESPSLASEPIIPISLLATPSILLACLVNWFMVMGVYTVLFFLPILHLLLPSASATYSGLLLSPFSIGISLGSLLTGLHLRTHSSTHPTTPVLLFLLATTSLLFPLLYSPITPLYIQLPNLFLFGAAYGGTLTAMLVSLLANVPPEMQAVITSASYAFRSTGSVIGVAVSGAIFQNILGRELDSRLGGKGRGAEEWAGRVKRSFEEVKVVPEEWRGEVFAAFEGALQGVWWYVGAVGVVALVCGIGIRRSQLGRR